MSSADSPDQNQSIPNIEASPSPTEQSLAEQGLDLRIRQQEILAELGVLALQRVSLQELLDSAVRMAAEGLKAQLSKILEYIPAESRLLMRAGMGWDPGLVGVATVGADPCITLGLRVADGQTSHFKSPRKRGAIPNPRTIEDSRRPSRNQRDPPGRRLPLWHP